MFFFTKKFLQHKNANQIKTNQQNKNKQTLNNKGNGFWSTKTSKRGKTVCFAFFKKTELILITSFTILLNYAVSTLQLSNYFYPSISTNKTLWPNHQDKQLLPHGTFKNTGSKMVRGMFHGWGTIAGSKPVRGRFHSFGTLTSKEALGT